MREFRLAFAFLAFAMLLPAATLERLSVDDMSIKSTDIVRARVVGARTAVRGPVIYTFYSIQVLERLKGNPAAAMEVAVPGGTAGGLRQTFSGAPKLGTTGEYVMFLWTGPSGVTHLTGLSQGLFDVAQEGNGPAKAMRAASTGLMLDAASHRVVEDGPVQMDLSELRSRVSAALARGASR